jgi:cytochrome P450
MEVLQPFSVGPRNCIGRRLVTLPKQFNPIASGMSRLSITSLAYAEGKLILGRAVWTFDFRKSEKTESWMTDQKGYVTWLRPPMEVFAKLRHG